MNPRLFIALLLSHGGRITLRRRMRRRLFPLRVALWKTPAQMEAKYGEKRIYAPGSLLYTPTAGQTVSM